MKLTVLADNNTYIDKYYIGEPALSYFIEFAEHRILFDAGYSDAFIQNAQKMGIDLNSITEVVLSHGHDDHTRGLQFLTDILKAPKRPLIAHPNAFNPKYNNNGYNGAPYSEEEISHYFQFLPSKTPHYINENVIFLGEIPISQSFEARRPIGSVIIQGEKVDDYAYDDSAMVFKTDRGLVIVTGCSHSGICNIIEYAKKVSHTEKIAAVIGGFHLKEVDERLEKTICYLEDAKIGSFYPCHCNSLKAKCAMNQRLDIIEVGVGLKVTF